MRRVKVVFLGRVQGVGFRNTAQKIARELALTGSVENLADGSVRATVQGDMHSQFLFLEQLTGLFSLSGIEISFIPLQADIADFTIIL